MFERFKNKIFNKSVERCKANKNGYCSQCHATMYAGFDERCTQEVIEAKARLLSSQEVNV